MGQHLRKGSAKRLMYVTSISPRPEQEPPVQNFVEADAEDSQSEDEERGTTGSSWLSSSGDTIKRKLRTNTKVTSGGRRAKRQKRRQYKIRYVGLTPGIEYKVTVSTTFRGKEVAENYLEFTTRPVPPAKLSVIWGLEAGDNAIVFKAIVAWIGGSSSSSCSYFVEVEDGALTLAEEVHEPRWSYVTDGRNSIKVRVWSVTAGDLRSEKALEQAMPPVPDYMRDYARSVERALPRGTVGSKYLFKVALMKQVAKELKDLYVDVQDATRMPKTRSHTVDDEAVSIRDVFGSREVDD